MSKNTLFAHARITLFIVSFVVAAIIGFIYGVFYAKLDYQGYLEIVTILNSCETKLMNSLKEVSAPHVKYLS